MNTIEIKNIYGQILFTHTCENNTIKVTLLEAIKRGANLRGADLSYANLSGANLSYANLRGADLRGVNLNYADLRGANLSNADLSSADLSGANLSGVNLRGADLRDIRFNENTAFFAMQCPSEGSFIAWKKVVDDVIVKLRVTENAKRSSATSLKCRCSEAEVLDIQDAEGGSLDIPAVASKHDHTFIYKKGEIVRVENFDKNRWDECSTGIHFFIDRAMAVNY